MRLRQRSAKDLEEDLLTDGHWEGFVAEKPLESPARSFLKIQKELNEGHGDTEGPAPLTSASTRAAVVSFQLGDSTGLSSALSRP